MFWRAAGGFCVRPVTGKEMSTAPRARSAPPGPQLTRGQQEALVQAGVAAADEFFNGDGALLTGYLRDSKSADARIAAAGLCASQAGVVQLARLLDATRARKLARFSSKLASATDVLYRLASDPSRLWDEECAPRLISAVHGLRAALPGVCVSYDAPPAPAPAGAATEEKPAPTKEEADKVQRIEIVAMPAQHVAITQMPMPGTLKVDVTNLPGMTQETTVQRHPNTDEILKTVTTSRTTKTPGG
jgi:hypothetical protein